MAFIPIHVLRAPGAIPRSVRDCLLSTPNILMSIQGAENIKCKRKDARCSQLSRVFRPADSAPSNYLPPFSIYLFIKWVKISQIILFTFKKQYLPGTTLKHTYIILGIRI